jgi:outer membrane protein assembly factor BamE (lipoprotein component of BamABCDE complex)
MKPGRLIAVVLLAAAGLWAWRNISEVKRVLPAGSVDSPKSSAPSSDSQLTEAAREAEKSSATGVTDNMTPDQVRGVLGSPDEVESFTTDAGKPGEKWTYRQAHRIVIFENGIAVSVQPI